MTIGLRYQDGHTRTFYQDGSRVRMANPSGTDDGEAHIIDLKTSEHIIVYDDAKAYYDFNKSLAPLRAAYKEYEKTHRTDRKKRAPDVSYRPLGEVRRVSGFACAMYERLEAGKPTYPLCFAPWGSAVGPREDFLWFDDLIERMISDVAGRRAKFQPHMLALEEGLVLWMSGTDDDGSRDTIEVVQISRDPVPAALLHVPSDYKEFSRPLTASEHPKIGPPPMDDGRPRFSFDRKLTTIIVVMMSFVIGVAVVMEALLLHLAACVLVEQNRFRQALLAAAVTMVAMFALGLMRLPPVVGTAFGVFVNFAGLKIAYGASVLRTLALWVLSSVFAVVIVLVVFQVFH